ncbi:MAG: nucleotidyltransferase family protein [Anaerolineales bacterium]
MPKTAGELTDAEIQNYRVAAQQRATQMQHESEAHAAHALHIARQAAALLKSDYSAQRVWLFGSVARGMRVHPRSDIDIAVEGLPAEHFWAAWCRLDTLAPGETIDLEPVESASPALLAEIQREGVEL